MLFALISFAALREFVTLTHTRRSDHWVLLGMFAIIIPVQYWLVWTAWYGLFTIFIPVYCFLLMPAITALHGDTERFLERIAAQQWAVMISVYCVSHVPALLTLDVPGFEGRNLLLIAFLIIMVQGSDVLQYIFGKLFGKHTLLAERLAVQDLGRADRRPRSARACSARALSFLTPFTPLQAARRRLRRLPDGLPRRAGRVGHQARPGRQGLGPPDRGPWRHDGPRRQPGLRRAGLLPHRPLLLDGLSPAEEAAELPRRFARRLKPPAGDYLTMTMLGVGRRRRPSTSA